MLYYHHPLKKLDTNYRKYRITKSNPLITCEISSLKNLKNKTIKVFYIRRIYCSKYKSFYKKKYFKHIHVPNVPEWLNGVSLKVGQAVLIKKAKKRSKLKSFELVDIKNKTSEIKNDQK